MDKTKKQSRKSDQRQNFIESLKDIGAGTAKGISQDVLRSQDFIDQILGIKRQQQQRYSGEITPGEALEISDIFSGKYESEKKLKQQIALERKLKEEEKARIEKKSNELKLQLKALMQEVAQLSQSTQNLAKEVQVASMQAPVEPGIYHFFFFEKLFEFIVSFRKKVEDASVWLHATNLRAQKKNYWARYKKLGSKFLLSGEHYLTRSAG